MASPKGISRQLGPKDNIGRCPHGAPLAMLKTRCPSCHLAELEAENARLQDGYDGLKCQYDEEHDKLLRLQERVEKSQAVLVKAKRQHNWETHGYYGGDEAGCLDCQRYAGVL